MSVTKVAVDVTKLSLGMYVSGLDRPWLETPFIFQGFEIKDRVEIDQLQSYCEHVYVDVDRGNLSDAEIRALMKSNSKRSTSITSQRRLIEQRAGWLERIGHLLLPQYLSLYLGSRARRGGGDYAIRSSVRAEAPRARQAFELARKTYRRIYAQAGSRGTIDVRLCLKGVRPIVESVIRNPDALAWTVFSRKRGGGEYSRAVATSVWATIFGRHLGFERAALRDLALGGLLLNIGEARLPEQIVNLEGSITHEQFRHLSTHVEIGVEILHGSPGIEPRVFDMVHCHHERADGSGYPRQLRGNEIPAFGRIAGIVDCYDAMTTKTHYSPAQAAYDSARELNDMREREFQREVVEQFLNAIGMFPTGSIVELNDGSIGVVLEQNRGNALQPKVMLLMDKSHRPLRKPRVVEMRKLLKKKWSASNGVWIERGHEHGAFGIDPLKYFA